jgi:CRP/FNR family transcriptional regulator, cyclic AMP receptor protein
VDDVVARHSARLSVEDRAAIAAYAAKAVWPAGFTLYERGARADGVFIVTRGRIILRSRVKTGRGFIPSIAAEGETFGAEGLTVSARYATDASAEIESETLFLGSGRFRTFMREQPARAMAVMSQIMEERTLLLDRLRELATLSVEQRLVNTLLRFSQSQSFVDGDGRIELTPARYRILCEMVGATRESVSLVLNRLSHEDLVDRAGNTFVVAPAARLRERLGGRGERALSILNESERERVLS